MEKWSKEKAWEWYNKLPWIRGFNFVPSISVNGIETWQKYNHKNVFECIKKELALASKWGFNSIRVSSCLYLYIDQHDTYMSYLEEFLQIASSNNISVMFVFGNDCVVTKENFTWPKYGRQYFDLGYHSGRANSPHVTLNAIGYNIIDEEKYEIKFYEMVKEIISKYKDDNRILIWDLYNEPGNSKRGMKSAKYVRNVFDLARSINPIQPLTVGCWSYNEKMEPFNEIELLSLELSDVISYHCYHNYEDTLKVDKYLKEKYDRPMFNTEWLHRIWKNNITDLFPLFRKERIGCYNWGFVTGKSQTREPWEWLFDVYDKDPTKDWDFSKWQHDLVRPDLRPYDYKEYEVILRECKLADEEYSK